MNYSKEKIALAQDIQLKNATSQSCILKKAIEEELKDVYAQKETLELLENEIDILLNGIGIKDFDCSLNVGEELGEEENICSESVEFFSTIRSIPYQNIAQYEKDVERYLKANGFEENKDPLYELFTSTEMKSKLDEFENRFGKLTWGKEDYIVVGLVAFISILIDFFLVSIPKDMNFMGKEYKGSPITKFLKEKTTDIYNNSNKGIGKWISELEDYAKVPYDISVNSKEKGINVPGLRPALHRLMEPGHDPILGFVTGVMDVLRGSCTIIDKNGVLCILENGVGSNDVGEAIIKVFAHLISDVFTSTGLPCPFMSLLQLCMGKSPFVIGKTGEKISFNDLSRYMYANGYDLRHFFSMSIETAFIELFIHLYFKFYYFDKVDESDIRYQVKKNNMLTCTHSIAMGGDVVKVWLHGCNPLAINYAEFIGLVMSCLRTMKTNDSYSKFVEKQLEDMWSQMIY